MDFLLLFNGPKINNTGQSIGSSPSSTVDMMYLQNPVWAIGYKGTYCTCTCMSSVCTLRHWKLMYFMFTECISFQWCALNCISQILLHALWILELLTLLGPDVYSIFTAPVHRAGSMLDVTPRLHVINKKSCGTWTQCEAHFETTFTTKFWLPDENSFQKYKHWQTNLEDTIAGGR